jgi:predicted aldo/keto reductase-like oxidoreductase
MKVCAQGHLLGPGKLTMAEAMGYVLSLPGVTNVIVGCTTPQEVEENASIARDFAPFNREELQMLEQRTQALATLSNYYKKQE